MGVRTDDPRFVDPVRDGLTEERRTVSRKQYERLQQEKAIEQARSAAMRWVEAEER